MWDNISQYKLKISWRFCYLERSLRNRAHKRVSGDIESLEIFKEYDHVLKLKSSWDVQGREYCNSWIETRRFTDRGGFL